MRRALISCWRRGDLSIDLPISRMSQGAGLRNATVPSLSINTSMNPCGRSRSRNVVSAVGSVSVMTMTSRSTSAGMSAPRLSICSMYRGSKGVSAKTTMARARQRKSFKFISDASKNWSGVACHSSGVTDCAAAGMPAKAMNMNVKLARRTGFMPINIGSEPTVSKGADTLGANNFSIKPLVRLEDAA